MSWLECVVHLFLHKTWGYCEAEPIRNVNGKTCLLDAMYLNWGVKLKVFKSTHWHLHSMDFVNY